MMRVFLAALVFFCAGMAHAQEDLTALARFDAADSDVTTRGQATEIRLRLSQPVPYRVFTLGNPLRVVMDFQEVDWSGFDPALFTELPLVDVANAGVLRPGWSRLVMTLRTPVSIAGAGMETGLSGGEAEVTLRLVPTSLDDFLAGAGEPQSVAWALPEVVETNEPIRRQTGDRPIVVVLDPGHGGIDPGAENGSVDEADLVLEFAYVLHELLIRSGFIVVMTRYDDSFVSLERRITLARSARADVFISLHADALEEGRATGATAYTLDEEASDEASARLAERHDRADLLAGVDLSENDDEIATVLMELARLETAPRSLTLAGSLIDGLEEADIRIYKHPLQVAAFSVLKAPDIPSVLLELGFLSNPRDLNDMQNDEWQLQAARGLVNALRNWASADAAEARLIRQ